jgi:hypothetical protein
MTTGLITVRRRVKELFWEQNGSIQVTGFSMKKKKRNRGPGSGPPRIYIQEGP